MDQIVSLELETSVVVCRCMVRSLTEESGMVECEESEWEI